jgi:hypothetical protein
LGPASGGQSVTITGSNLSSSSSVTFGGSAATITNNTATSITIATPPHAAGAVDILIVTATGSVTAAGAYTYVLPPVVSGVNPSSAGVAGGEIITINGLNLGNVTSVTFGGNAAAIAQSKPGVRAASITANSQMSITVTAPSHAEGVVDIVVTTPGGSYTVASGFTYTASVIAPIPALSMCLLIALGALLAAIAIMKIT